MMLYVQIFLVVGLVILSAFFAGSETGVYRMSRFRLRFHPQNNTRGRMLKGMIRDSHGLILSLLLGNNLVNYLATGLVTWLFLTQSQNEHLAEIYASLLMTPVLFIFGEILPKNLFYFRADFLMSRLSPLTWFFYKIFTLSGAVAALKWVSHGLGRLLRIQIDTSRAVDLTQRQQVKQIFHETREEGLVSELQKKMMDRLIKMTSLPVTSMLIPLEKIQKTQIRTDREELMRHLNECPYSRILVYEDRPQEIVGFISLYQVLGSGRTCETLKPWLRPVIHVNASVSVMKTIEKLRKHNGPIALVYSDPQTGTRGKTRLLGMVTLQDLMEELIQ